MRRFRVVALLLSLATLGSLAGSRAARAAGTLTPVGSGLQPIETRDHRVEATLLDGFATVEVHQTFFNPNDEAVEAIFTLPLPESASLSEMTVFVGESELQGEVLERSEAERLYEEEKSRGHDTGLATKESYQSFDFRVSPVLPGDETTIRFLYYQPLAVDTGVGRFVYPLEDGGTDEMAKSFWLREERVTGTLSIRVEVASSWPIAELRVPGFEAAATVTELPTGAYEVTLDRPGAAFDADFVVYYRLEDDLPGRVELVAYRPDPSQPGTFMMVLTPALDLGPIEHGSDFVFVLDTSGSMAGKIGTLARGVVTALGELSGEDRFRIVTFSERAHEITRGWVPATDEEVRRWAAKIEGLGAGGSTNMYAGLETAFERVDDDRATSVVLVTDAVTNTGVIAPKAFAELLGRADVRVFGFLLGNASNWPLMRLICDTSGGFYAPVSNQDDVLGQILLARSKVTHEVLHDARVEVQGVDVFDVVGAAAPGKVYRGEQLVLFGHYDRPGEARVALEARLTGEDRAYRTRFEFPAVATEHPELERLWALARVEELEQLMDAGLFDPTEGDEAIAALGVEYQIVTDETAMVVMADAAFDEHGVERRNRERVAIEQTARSVRRAQPAVSRRVDDHDPMFGGRKAPRLGGSGDIGPLGALLLLGGAAALLRRLR